MRGDQFQRDENRRIWCQAHRRQILAGQVQLDSLLQVAGDLIERLPLGDDRDLHAFGHVAGLLARSDHRLDCSLKHLYRLLILAFSRARHCNWGHSTEGEVGIARDALS